MVSLEKISRATPNLVKVIVILAVFALGFWIRGFFILFSASPETDEHVHETVAKKQIWTCSMHPQIRYEKKGLCPICNMDLIPASDDGSEGATSLRQLTVSESAKKLMDIVTAPVERRFVEAAIRMVGKVDYDETRLAYITSWIPGRLDRLFVDYTGVPVREGDHLVSIYSPSLLSAQEELIQAIKTVKNVQDSELSIIRETAQATVVAAREKLRLWGLTAGQIEKVEVTGKVSDHITIYAPAGGIVIHKNALEGMYVKEGDQIYTIADLSQVWVKLDAYESDLEWLRYGQKVEFTTVSYPGEIFTGTIAFIDPVLNERTRTVKIRVNVLNDDGRLKPKMFVKAVVRAQVAAGGRIMDSDLAGKWICPMHPDIIKPGAAECDICEMPLVTSESLGYISDDPAANGKPLVIPVGAALTTGTRAIVYIEIRDVDVPTFEGREIVLGPRAGDYYIVRNGLEEGDRVVVKGNFKIDSDLQIMARPSMTAPGGLAGKTVSKDDISPLVRYQLQEVLTAAESVDEALDNKELHKIHTAFSSVALAIQAVDMEQLKGDGRMLWMELSMRLRNDVTEGGDVKTAEDAAKIVAGMAANLELLRSAFHFEAKQDQGLQPSLNEEFRNQLAGVFGSYFTLQEALANDQLQKATEATEKTLAALKGVDMMLLDGESHDQWMGLSLALQEILTNAAGDQTIEKLRESFHLLSQQLIKVSKQYGSVIKGPTYIVHCPMAFNNSGANWLQTSDQVRNPYFGEMMLKCGGVEEVIPAKKIWKKESD